MTQQRRAGEPVVTDADKPFRAAFQASPVPQLLLRGGAVADANLAACQALAASREALIGRPARELLAGADAGLAADDAVVTPLTDVAGGPNELMSWPPRSGAQRSGPCPEERLRAMLTNLPSLWFRIDAAGHFRDAHAPESMKLLAPPEAFLGEPMERVLPPDLARLARMNLEMALTSDQPVRFDYALPLDGEERWFQCYMTRVGDDEVFTYVTDITARKASEAALERAVQEAKAAALMRSRFVATVSHEVRTPLNGILGMADLLRDTELDDEQDSYVAMLDNAGRALLNVINDVLDFSKIEAGHLRLRPAAFSPRDVVEGVLAMLAERAHVRGLEICATIAHDVPPTAVADPTRIEQVLLNLFGNALKFTSEGSVAVRVSVVRDPPGGLVLRHEVVDTGVGIAPDVLPRVFAPFEQGDAITARRVGGTGLGLAICLRLAELMGGHVSAESALGAGSTFRFDVPVGLPTEARTPAPGLRPGVTAGGRPLNVLAFTPGERLREQLAHELPHLGADLWASGDWGEVLARLSAAAQAGAPPHLVLVQLTFDEAENAAMVAALAALPPLPRVVAIVAFGRRDQLSALRDAPFTEVVAAPIRLAELRDLVARAAAADDG